MSAKFRTAWSAELKAALEDALKRSDAEDRATMTTAPDGLALELAPPQVIPYMVLGILGVLVIIHVALACGSPWSLSSLELVVLGGGDLLALFGALALLRHVPSFPTRIGVRDAHSEGYRRTDVRTLIQIQTREEVGSEELLLLTKCDSMKNHHTVNAYLVDHQGKLHTLWGRTSYQPEREFARFKRLAMALGVRFERTPQSKESSWDLFLVCGTFALALFPLRAELFSIATNLLLFVQILASGSFWIFWLTFLPLHRAAQRVRGPLPLRGDSGHD